MTEKNIKSRIVHKHDIEAHWNLATNFVPLQGEIIIYDIDENYNYERFKIGDGITNVNELPFANSDNSTTGAGIIDVVELPTENINEEAFYRLLIGTFVYNGFVHNGCICYCVETLPETGEPATNADMSIITTYYNVEDGVCYGYIDSALNAMLGVPIGWYDVGTLLSVANVTYGGTVASLEEASEEDTMYLLLEYVIYSYKSGWTALKFIGKSGTGAGAEVFNHPSNTASGGCSHAEGYGTTASGLNSHAEGEGTTAGDSCSHAEGYSTAASGLNSHAEGNNTTASGYNSHVEGVCTIANGLSQHVQGEHNIVEEGVQPYQRGRYAHIVGNGNAQKRSNAHTLDWSGNAWFQGNVYVGGTGQDDAAAKKLITETELENKGYLTQHQSIKTINGETLIGEGDITTSAIIDVTEPLVGVFNTQTLYRTSNTGKVIKAEIATAGRLAPELGTIEIVDVLPATGMPAIDPTNNKYYVYYLTSENAIYGYITELLASNLGALTGWYKPEDLGMTVVIVDSADKAVTEDLYAVITRQSQLFHYTNDSFERIATESDLADCKAIVEVDDFSKHNANAHTLYRSKGDVTSIEFVRNNEILSNFTCNIVDTLPEIGEQFFSFDTNQVSLVYQKQDCQIYGYIVEEVATEDMEAGWYEATILMLALDELSGVGQYGGVISSLDQAIDSTKIYALTARGDGKPTFHYYRELDNGFAKGEIGAGYSEIVSIKEETIEEIYPETTLNIVTNLDSDRMALLSGEELLVKDVSYRVTFDGVVYNLVCRTGFFSEDMTEPILMMGNVNIFGYQPSMDTGEPFAVFTRTGIGTVLCTATTGDHTISISKVEATTREEEVIHKIDPKYYDAGSGGGSPMTSITYDELKALRDSGSLVAGMFYRITDYVCTTAQENTGAMNNQFDIIVQALNESTLSETASADLHEGDTYFADTNFGAWELRYCLDNDTNRFAWADTENGKGVIYYMKDEFGNECPYDFKNITYKGDSLYEYEAAGFDANTYYPTFTNLALVSYLQWGGTWGVSRNSSLDTTIDGVAYYGYTCSSTPTAWASSDFYVTDAEITTSSTMYTITDGVVSTVSYGGNLTVNDFENSANVKNNVIYGKIETWGGQKRSLPYIVFIGNACNYNTIHTGNNFVFEGNEGIQIIAPGVSYLIFSTQAHNIMILKPQVCGERISGDKYGVPSTTDTNKVVYDGRYVDDIGALFDKLDTQGYPNGGYMIVNTMQGSYAGKVIKNNNGVGVENYAVYLSKSGELVSFIGTDISPDTSLSDILGDESPYKIDPIAKIAALEARIAALEGKTIPTEESLKSYIDETILGGEW